MPGLPNLTNAQVAGLISGAADVVYVDRGGQKQVFRATIDGQVYALKFARLIAHGDDDFDDFTVNDSAQRAKREVDTMRDCHSPYMVKLGPIGLTFAKVDGEPVAYFSEEFIDGKDLRTVLKTQGQFPADEIAKLGLQMASAVKALWELRTVHRDIKPANIMRRDASGDYVLLDAGLAFDLDGESISVGPVGTPAYFSPEQFEFTNRRTILDFRSDLFSLGVTLYHLATGEHPFFSPGDNSQSIYSKITEYVPPPIGARVSDFPEDLGEIVARLMGKSPHLRFRTCDQLIAAIERI